jgi:hypothetical protein
MQVWVFLHIATMFVSVAAGEAGNWLVAIGVRRRDIGALRAFDRLSGPFDTLSIGALVIGIAFGLVAAWTGGIDLTAGWLLAAYALVGLGFAVGVLAQRYYTRLVMAVRATEDGQIGPELEALLRSRVPLALAIWSPTLITLIVADMVLKPF